MYMNSCMVNYAIKYSKQLLANPNVFMKHTLNSFITENIINTKLDNRFKNSLAGDMDNYIFARKEFIKRRNAQGDIIANEDLFKCTHSIDFENQEGPQYSIKFREQGLNLRVPNLKVQDSIGNKPIISKPIQGDLKWMTIGGNTDNINTISASTTTLGTTSYEIGIDGKLKKKETFEELLDKALSDKIDPNIEEINF